MLRGTTTDTYITAKSGVKYYVLSQKDGIVGMYLAKINDEGTFLNNAHKAYLPLDLGNLGIYDENVDTSDGNTQLSNSLRFDFGETTSIDHSEIITHKSEIIYDLSGRCVENPTKGIYIVNGKKVIF